jgi:hypothetical protein
MIFTIVGKQLHLIAESREDESTLEELKKKAIENHLETSTDTTLPYGEGNVRWKVPVETI